jgi:hypothetical protein
VVCGNLKKNSGYFTTNRQKPARQAQFVSNCVCTDKAEVTTCIGRLSSNENDKQVQKNYAHITGKHC